MYIPDHHPRVRDYVRPAEELAQSRIGKRSAQHRPAIEINFVVKAPEAIAHTRRLYDVSELVVQM